MKTRNKSGFSIVEVVIALTVIVIVSVCALSIVLSSVATKERAINKSHAQNFASNIWECFKAANTYDDFRFLVSFAAEDVNLVETTTELDATKTYTYKSKDNKFKAEIFVDYVKNKLEVYVTDMDDDEIISFDYQKGGGI